MVTATFPVDILCRSIARFLDAIEYKDDNWTREERAETLRYVYSRTVAFFHQPVAREAVKHIRAAKIAAVSRTCTLYAVYSLPHVTRDILVGTSIYNTILAILDDQISADPSSQMATFWDNMFRGEQQSHPFWILMGELLPDLLSHYGPFCTFNIMRSTFNYFQGCWMEQRGAQAYPGASAYPIFLRHIAGLGGSCAGALFPADTFDEHELFNDISVAMAQIDAPVYLINDLCSFYKEWERDEANLVSNWCTVDDMSMEQALERLTEQTIESSVQMMRVFEGRDPKVRDTIRSFLHGYVTFHFCDLRYRLREVYENAGGSPAEVKFREYYEKNMIAGWIDIEEWAMTQEELETDASPGEGGPYTIQLRVEAL